MVAQSVIEHSSPSESISSHPLLADVAAGIEHLRERGALSFGRSYAAATRTSEHRLLLVTRASGASTVEGVHLVDAEHAIPPLPATLAGPFAVLRALLSELTHRSALFVPAPHLTAFAVAGLPLPIVYGSGLLRRTPEAVPVVPWTDALDPASVLSAVKAHPRSSAVLLARRGVLAYGDESIATLAKFVSNLEESAQLTFNAQLLGGARALPADAFERMQRGIAGD